MKDFDLDLILNPDEISRVSVNFEDPTTGNDLD